MPGPCQPGDRIAPLDTFTADVDIGDVDAASAARASSQRAGGAPVDTPVDAASTGDAVDAASTAVDAAWHAVATGHYAAQLAWWLQFFPPERFLVVTSAQLAPGPRLQVRRPARICS